MATQSTYPAPLAAPAQATRERGPGGLERWRERRAERQQARLVSPRHRRVLAQGLRRAAKGAVDPDPLRGRHDVLLHDRAAAVRTELIAIAAMLERADRPDPACVTALHELLANGCDSPLYNGNIHPSELQATLEYIRSGL